MTPMMRSGFIPFYIGEKHIADVVPYSGQAEMARSENAKGWSPYSGFCPNQANNAYPLLA
jgi:hypothetical protein